MGRVWATVEKNVWLDEWECRHGRWLGGREDRVGKGASPLGAGMGKKQDKPMTVVVVGCV